MNSPNSIASAEGLFRQQWAPWVAGILLAVANILLFAFEKPWSAADGVRNWGDWVFNGLGVAERIIIAPHLYSTSLLNFGVVGGALAAALLAGQFRLRGAAPRELVKGLVGGALMGLGSAMAFGCNIGGFFSAMSALSLAGISMMAGLMLGAYLGLRLLIWEVEHFAFTPLATTATAPLSAAQQHRRRLLGGGVLVASLTLALIYDAAGFPLRGGFLLFGVALGVIMQRSRFCFVRAFREPFLSGDGSMTRAVILATAIGVIGFSILKWTDLRAWDTQVSAAFWFGSLLGGTLFGVGMSLAGGCATGCLWRAGEGQVKLMLALLAFSLSGAWFRGWLGDSGWSMRLGDALFLPDLMSWKLSLALVATVLGLWYWVVDWNERSGKLVAG